MDQVMTPILLNVSTLTKNYNNIKNHNEIVVQTYTYRKIKPKYFYLILLSTAKYKSLSMINTAKHKLVKIYTSERFSKLSFSRLIRRKISVYSTNNLFFIL